MKYFEEIVNGVGYAASEQLDAGWHAEVSYQMSAGPSGVDWCDILFSVSDGCKQYDGRWTAVSAAGMRHPRANAYNEIVRLRDKLKACRQAGDSD